MSKFKQFLTSTLALVSIELPIKATLFLTTILLIRLIPPIQYGQYTSLLALATLIISLGGGIQVVMIRRCAVQQSFDLQWGYVLLSLKFQCFILMLAAIIGFFFIKDVFLWAGLILYCIGVSGFTLLCVGHQAIKRVRTYAFIGIARNLLVILIIIMLSNFVVLRAVNIFYIIGLISIGFLVVFLSMYSSKVQKELNIELLPIIKENISLIVYYAFIGAYTQVDIALVSYFLPSEQVAIYGVGLRYYFVSLLLLPPIVNAIRIHTSMDVFEGNAKKQLDFLNNWFRHAIPAVVLFGIVSFYLSPLVLGFLNGPEYSESIRVFRYMLIGSMAMYIFCPIVSLLITNNRYSALILLAILSTLFKSLSFWFYLSFSTDLAFVGLVLSISIIFYNLFSFCQYRYFLAKESFV
jgi:O-antigen/teichoic acid export membrane protein